MSHYHSEVWIPEILDVESQIMEIMNPYNEALAIEQDEFEESHWYNPNGWWDWFQIGGRWTGAHTPDYHPEEDEQNYENCMVCGGGGFRRDKFGEEERLKTPSYTCNGCGHYDDTLKIWTHGKFGKGKQCKWPTQWAKHSGDIIPVSEINDKLDCYTLIVGDNVYQTEIWEGGDFKKTDFDGNVKNMLDKLNITTGFLVTVDYHN